MDLREKDEGTHADMPMDIIHRDGSPEQGDDIKRVHVEQTR
jgi:hypothetical protein